MEKSSVNERNKDLRPGGGLPVLTRRFPSSQGLSAPLQFISPEVRNYLIGRDRLTNQCNVYLARTVVDNFIKSEVDTGI